ncbi:uncharacterized protein LOC114574501 [Exaiptasia diaphana]|uniref:Uncharacterized protein n=1 Tax=Exaiptasia diaphana TaxID=2652724 RepID=A0A913YCN5_EXADI|nr:uncharacterized protein LOC114574501 [Exaiptasia diaphana]
MAGNLLRIKFLICIVGLLTVDVVKSLNGTDSLNGTESLNGTDSYKKCNVYTERLGCYKDSVLPSRPLPELVFTDRDSTSPAYTGGFIDLKNWNLYMEDLRCRCAEESRAKGYKVFGLQFYGECWSGPKANETYFQNGESDQCVTHDLAHCTAAEEDCVGRDYTNFIYEIHETPVINHTHNVSQHVNMTHTLAKNITLAHHNHTLNITTTPKPPVIPTNPPTNPQPREVPGYVPPPGCQPSKYHIETIGYIK